MRVDSGSLRRRLVLWLLVSMAGLSALILADVFYTAQETADRVYDRVLRGSGLAIAERVVVAENGRLEVDVPYVALEMLTSAAQDRVYYRVESNGASVTGYGDLPADEASRSLAPGQSTVYDATYRGADIRVIAIAGAASGTRKSIPFTVFVAETTQARSNLVQQMLMSSAWRLAATIAAALLIVWLGVQWGLRPLSTLEAALGRRSPNDLRPIRHAVPREAQRIVEAINDLMARLSSALESQKRFTGNAGHQLRTPLAVVKTQLELALRERDPTQMRAAIREAYRATQHSGRLVEQLLLLARVDAESDAKNAFEAFDLAGVARDTTIDFATATRGQKFDLGFENVNGAARIIGHKTLVAEALSNLLQNAMAYCPEGSSITVRAGDDGQACVLEVEDDGPGIPPARRREVRERFVRLGTSDAAGSGLGLAIVQEIAALHGGSLELADGAEGKGLLARISFSDDAGDSARPTMASPGIC